jgi:hypothetical protein
MGSRLPKIDTARPCWRSSPWLSGAWRCQLANRLEAAICACVDLALQMPGTAAFSGDERFGVQGHRPGTRRRWIHAFRGPRLSRVDGRGSSDLRLRLRLSRSLSLSLSLCALLPGRIRNRLKHETDRPIQIVRDYSVVEAMRQDSRGRVGVDEVNGKDQSRMPERKTKEIAVMRVESLSLPLRLLPSRLLTLRWHSLPNERNLTRHTRPNSS